MLQVFPVDGKLLREKALHIACHLGVQDCCTSNGCIYTLKKYPILSKICYQVYALRGDVLDFRQPANHHRLPFRWVDHPPAEGCVLDRLVPHVHPRHGGLVAPTLLPLHVPLTRHSPRSIGQNLPLAHAFRLYHVPYVMLSSHLPGFSGQRSESVFNILALKTLALKVRCLAASRSCRSPGHSLGNGIDYLFRPPKPKEGKLRGSSCASDITGESEENSVYFSKNVSTLNLTVRLE
ncbi:hypothetical protein PR048_026511 [Dryococelus australis]|uniref:Uncharacterized protein n=1 Tax=Dryococelus australis TaxID=614101 RepID=A0ABQ9GLJ1_9NEOP|nr:hypothetical protein PR048_026511 [Dryococelus australis]